MKKLAIFLGVACLLVLSAVPVYAQPPLLPHAFYGSVTINNSPAPVGTQVEARGTGVETGVAGNPVTTTASGIYGTTNPFEPRLIVQGDITEGATLTFYVNGHSTGQTHPWHSGEVTELNLSVTIPEPPPPTTPPPPPTVTPVDIPGFTATVPLEVDDEGIVQTTTRLTTDDGKMSLDISQGTSMLDADGNPLTSISAAVEPSPPAPPPESAVILAYNLGPAGATFEPPLILTMTYDPDDIPEGVAEEDLYIAYWDGSEWVTLETTVDTVAKTVSCQVSHFRPFAVFSPAPEVRYDLTISSTTGGSVTTPGEGTFTYDEGTAVNLVATPDSGYRFVNWTGDVGTVADTASASTSITMDGSYSITANFEAIPPDEYGLTISSTTGGSVTTPGEGTFTYDEGTAVNLVATPDSGYRFVSWTGDVDTIADTASASTSITMDGNYSITASFEAIPPDEYGLTISSTTGGSVTTPGEGTFTYDEGTAVNLMAEADEGYRFVNWTGDVDTIADTASASTSITMDGNYSITASFEAIPPDEYGLTISSTTGGSVTTPGEGTFTYDEGTAVNLMAEADEGYRFVNWTGDVDTIADIASASTSITMDGNYSITANFEEVPPEPVNWLLIAGIAGAVLLAGLVIFLILRIRGM